MTQESGKKPLGRPVIYGFFLISVIALSGATIYSYGVNQSLKYEYQMNALSLNAQEVGDALNAFHGEYNQGIWNLEPILSSSALDNSTKSQAVYDFFYTIGNCAEEEDSNFYYAMNHLGYFSDNYVAYDQISQIVLTALHLMFIECASVVYNDSTSLMETVPFINSFYNVAGLNDSCPQLTGLRGILFSLLDLSTYYSLKANDQNTDGFQAPKVSLNFALANATELNETMYNTWEYIEPISTPF